MNLTPQAWRVLEYLQDRAHIEPMQALKELGVYRLSARINELRKGGCEIKTELVPQMTAHGDVAKVARYWLKGCPLGTVTPRQERVMDLVARSSQKYKPEHTLHV